MSKRRLVLWSLTLLAGVAALYALVPAADVPPTDLAGVSEPRESNEGPGLLTTGVRSTSGEAPAPAPVPAGGKGSVVLIMVDAKGQRIQDSTQEVYLFWRAKGSSGSWEREGVPRCHAKEGEGRIDDVPVGKEVQVRVVDRTYFTTLFEASGPTVRGEVVRIEVPLGSRRPVLTGLLVDAEGQAVAEQSVTVTEWLDSLLPDGFAQTIGVRTDVRGRFRKTLVYSPDKDTWLYFKQDRGEVVWKARLKIPVDASGELDVGTIVLAPVSELVVIARGRVVGETGQALWRHASVRAYTGEGADTVILTRVSAKVQRDGAFEIRTGVKPVPETFRVEAHMRGRAKDVKTVSRGAEDVVLRLVPGGRLLASFRIPAGIPGDRIVGYIHRHGSKRGSAPNQYGGRFGRDNLRAGIYDITIRIRSSPWELWRVEGIDVPAGGAADDARILDISLEGLVRSCRVRVQAPDGKSLAGRHVRVDTPDGERASFTVRRDGVVTIVVPPRYEAFTLSCNEVGKAEVSWSVEEQTVTLR